LPLPLPVESPPAVSPTTQVDPSKIEEGIRAMQEVFQNAQTTPHWPMYLRNVKQFIKNAAPAFDERSYGFASFLEAVRSGQRAGLFRLERNRQGILRVYPGSQIPTPLRVTFPRTEPTASEESIPMIEDSQAAPAQQQIAESAPVIEVQEPSLIQETIEEAPAPESPEKPARKRRAAGTGIKRKPATTRTRVAAIKRTRKKPPVDGEPVS
jgi:hypothetical protein